MGAYSVVVLGSRWAIMLPRLTRLARGMRSNRWKRECWHEWGPAFSWHIPPLQRYLEDLLSSTDERQLHVSIDTRD